MQLLLILCESVVPVSEGLNDITQTGNCRLEGAMEYLRKATGHKKSNWNSIILNLLLLISPDLPSQPFCAAQAPHTHPHLSTLRCVGSHGGITL